MCIAIPAPGSSGPADRFRRWKVFSAAPHRMMFFPAAVQLVLVMSFWGVELLLRLLGQPLSLAVPPIWVHLFMMIYGVFPFFIFGFLMTTYPRWMRWQEIGYLRYAGAWWLLVAGMGVVWIGLLVHAVLMAAGVMLFLAGWLVALGALLKVYRQTPVRGKLHETHLNLALMAGWLGAALFALWLFTGHYWLLSAARQIGLWLFLVPVFFTVAHRMIPFFSSVVLKPYQLVQPSGFLPAMWVAVSGHALLEGLGMPAWTFPFDLLLAGMAFYLSSRWGLVRAQSVRLLGVLHIAFLWLGVAMGLYALDSLIVLSNGSSWLGRAPLHALGIGCMAGMVIAMATRVTRGHSGRPLEMNLYTWWCFLGVNAAAVVRITAELVPVPGILHAYLLSALLWLLATGGWAIQYAPVYLRPRVDGKPG